MLQARRQDARLIHYLVAKGVPDAYVPIITAVIRGIPMDFTYARLALAVIPDDLELKDDNLLKNLDERCVRSLGGESPISGM